MAVTNADNFARSNSELVADGKWQLMGEYCDSLEVPARTCVARGRPIDIGCLFGLAPVAQKPQDEQTDPTRVLRSLSSFCLGFVSIGDVVVRRRARTWTNSRMTRHVGAVAHNHFNRVPSGILTTLPNRVEVARDRRR